MPYVSLAKYRIVKRMRFDELDKASFSKDTLSRLNTALRKMKTKTKKQASDALTLARRRHEIKELAFRIMYCGEMYPGRPSDTVREK